LDTVVQKVNAEGAALQGSGWVVSLLELASGYFYQFNCARVCSSPVDETYLFSLYFYVVT